MTDEDEDDPGTRARRTDDEMHMFLALATALHLMLTPSITEKEATRAHELLQMFVVEFHDVSPCFRANSCFLTTMR